MALVKAQVKDNLLDKVECFFVEILHLLQLIQTCFIDSAVDLTQCNVAHTGFL